jgi:hypothetical protein
VVVAKFERNKEWGWDGQLMVLPEGRGMVEVIVMSLIVVMLLLQKG